MNKNAFSDSNKIKYKLIRYYRKALCDLKYNKTIVIKDEGRTDEQMKVDRLF